MAKTKRREWSFCAYCGREVDTGWECNGCGYDKCSAHAIERCWASACRTEFREMHAEAEIEGLREKIATLEARIKELESRIVYAAGELVGPTKPYLYELKKERDAIVERQRLESR